jgi:hypothetical protein
VVLEIFELIVALCSAGYLILDPTFIDEMSCVMPSQPDWLGGRKCDAALNLTCQATLDNPNQNTTSFDDFGVACLSIFQSITLEGWAFIGYHVMNSVSDWAVIYFVLLVIWGTFFFMNLFLAAIQGVYVVVHEEEKQHESLLVRLLFSFPSTHRIEGKKMSPIGTSYEEATQAPSWMLGALCTLAKTARGARSSSQVLVL